MITTPLAFGAIATGLAIGLAIDVAVDAQIPPLPLPSANDATYLVEASVYDGIGVAVTLQQEPRALAAADPLAAGPLAAGRILASPDFGVTTKRWSDRGWTSSPSDSVANTHFPGRASQPLALQWGMALSPADDPRITVAGEIALENRDGGEDQAASLGFDGRPVTIKRGAPTDAYAAFETVFQAYAAGAPQVSGDQVQLAVRARNYALDVPLAPLYGGTGGTDGGSEVEGKPKPTCWGFCRNVTPVLFDTANLVFDVHGIGRVGSIAVYDRGVALVNDGDYASYAALTGASITAGRYATCLAEGKFRLASTPAYPVTADVAGDASTTSTDGGGYVSSPALLIRRILLDRGALAFTALDHAAIEAAHMVSGGTAGAYFTDQVSVEDAVSFIAARSWLRWGQKGRAGTLGVWRIAPPGTPSYAIGVEHLLSEPTVLPLPEAVNPCLWRAVGGYARNWTPMADADIASSVTAARRQFLRQQWRTTAQADTSRQTANLLARSIELETVYDQESDAQSLLANLLTLFAPGRRLIEGTIPARRHLLELLATHRLTHPRHGLSAGVALAVQSLREDCGAREISAVLFG